MRRALFIAITTVAFIGCNNSGTSSDSPDSTTIITTDTITGAGTGTGTDTSTMNGNGMSGDTTGRNGRDFLRH